jgi:hypothetical protein
MKHYLRQIGNTRSKIKEKEKEFMKTKWEDIQKE